MLPTDFALYPIDDDSRLFISPGITDWSVVRKAGIEVVLDLEGGLDLGVPTIPNGVLYVYFPFHDTNVPDVTRLRAVSTLGARLVASGQRVLSHCGMGFNRSALVAGLILLELGFTGPQAVERLRERRAGALFNEEFASYLASL
jgi:protein-tyrosine phosphatase